MNKNLTTEQKNILFEEGTEAPGSSPLNFEKREGYYCCVGCGTKLFESTSKYESGSGWPSFFKSLPNVFETKIDTLIGSPRTEYHCKKCGGHHGHIFNDGPKPTGKRYCNNGICLVFVSEKNKMIKQLPSKEVEEYLKNNPKCVLLDVRTEEEWNEDGRPDGEKFGLKTYFLPIQFADKSLNENFEEEFKKLNIKQDHEILTMCMGGVRSQAAAELITKKNYKCINISDGFLGNNENIGWKRNSLPCK